MPPTSPARSEESLLARVLARVDEQADRFIGYRHHLHRHPELSNHERRTTEFVSRVLRGSGIPHRTLPNGTGLIAELGEGEGPVIALRADIDALPITEQTDVAFRSENPGAMHACGHDVHTAALLGAAVALAAAPRPAGRVRFIFQPAEEVMTGALEVIEAGALAEVEQIFMVHVSPDLEVGEIGVAARAATASSDALTIRLEGAGGHSSRPDLTADLVYALGGLITGLPGLLTRRLDPLESGVLVWGQVVSGSAPNVIPETALLRGTLRLLSRSAWDAAPELVSRLVTELLAPSGAGFELDYQRGVPPVINDPSSVELVRAFVTERFGSQALKDLPQNAAGEDFAYYLDHAPGAFVAVGVWNGLGAPPSVHTSRFEADDRAVAIGAKTYAGLALRWLSETRDRTSSAVR